MDCVSRENKWFCIVEIYSMTWNLDTSPFGAVHRQHFSNIFAIHLLKEVIIVLNISCILHFRRTTVISCQSSSLRRDWLNREGAVSRCTGDPAVEVSAQAQGGKQPVISCRTCHFLDAFVLARNDMHVCHRQVSSHMFLFLIFRLICGVEI